jgi:RNA polymerase sigma factor (sigma-70 family)
MHAAVRYVVRASEQLTPHARAELQELVLRLADGDRSAVDPAFRAMWPLVRAYSARALSNHGDADDVAQRAILRFFEQVADFDPTRDALAWVLTIAGFECRTYRRQVARRKECAGIAEVRHVRTTQPTPEDAAVERDLEEAARQVLGTLGDSDVRTILAAIAEDRTEQERGPTFRKRLERALVRLRLAWRAKHESR